MHAVVLTIANEESLGAASRRIAQRLVPILFRRGRLRYGPLVPAPHRARQQRADRKQPHGQRGEVGPVQVPLPAVCGGVRPNPCLLFFPEAALPQHLPQSFGRETAGRHVLHAAIDPRHIDAGGLVIDEEEILALAMFARWLPLEGTLDTGRVETVYNLRVANFHTYFVGSREWGSRRGCIIPTPTKLSRSVTDYTTNNWRCAYMANESLWDRFGQLVTILPTHGRPPTTLRESDIQRFEFQVGIRLPESFRDFVIRFGGGELSGFFRLFRPFNGGFVKSCDLGSLIAETNR